MEQPQRNLTAECADADVWSAEHRFERIEKIRLGAGEIAVREACMDCGLENDYVIGLVQNEID
jgi:hypothetical protein